MVFGGGAALTVTVLAAVLHGVPRADSLEETGDDSIGFADLLRDGAVRRILALSAVTYAPIVTVTGLWGGPYLQEIHGFSPEAAGQGLMVLFAATIAAGFSFGRIDRAGRGRNAVILSTAFASAVCFAGLGLLPAPPT